jgi:hypothetical protein
LTKVLLAVIAAGVWVLILKPVLRPGPVRAAARTTQTKVVRAEKFELVDSQGRVRAELVVPGGNSGPKFALMDIRGRERALLFLVRDTNGALQFLGKDGNANAELGLDEGGIPALHFHHRTRAGISLALDYDDSPSLLMRGQDGKVLWKAP